VSSNLTHAVTPIPPTQVMMMRRSAVLIATLAVLAARLPAQTFEGTVSVKTDSTDPNALLDLKLHLKGSQVAIVGMTGAGSQLGPGVEMRILIDWTTMKSTMLMPLAGAMAQMAQMNPSMKGIKIVSDIPASVVAKAGGVKPLGTSETIAGHRCDDFEETGVKVPHQLCLTKEFGRFTMPSTAGRGGRGGGPSWTTAIGDNGFPLKVWTPGGKVDFEATSVRPGNVPAATFAIPDGYVDMGGLGRMGGRGGF
jgi:hypothetical protein